MVSFLSTDRLDGRFNDANGCERRKGLVALNAWRVMGRMSQAPRATFNGVELADYDAVIERMVRMRSTIAELTPQYDEEIGAPDIGEYWGALLYSPPMAAITIAMGRFVRTAADGGNTFSHADREFVDQVLAADWKTNVVQGHHVPDAVSSGVRIEAIDALLNGREEELTDDERLLAAYIRATVNGTVDDVLFAAMRERLGPRGLIEYTGFILWLQWIIRMMQVLGCHDPADAEIRELVAGIKDGSIPVPDFRDRIA